MMKTIATRCYILRPKCTKFDFSWNSAPDFARGTRSAPQTSSWIEGVLLLREGEKKKKRGKRKKRKKKTAKKERRGEEKEKQGDIPPPTLG